MCGGIGISHLSYASSAPQAAAFVARAIGGMGSGSGGNLAGNLAGLVGKGGKGLFGNGKNSSKGFGIAKDAKNARGKGKDTAMRLADNYDMPRFITDVK